MRKSFAKNFLGQDYDSYMSIARIYAAVYVAANVVVYVLSLSFHNYFIEWLYSYARGFNLFGLAFIAALVVALDIPVEISEDKDKKPLAYRFSQMWSVLLLAGGIFINYLSYSSYNRYHFECTIWYVEESTGVYHLYNDCEAIKDDEVYCMYGYELYGEDVTFCDACREFMKEMEE